MERKKLTFADMADNSYNVSLYVGGVGVHKAFNETPVYADITNLVPRVSLSPPPRALGGGERETLGTRLRYYWLA